MSDRTVPYDENAICDNCGKKGAHDFMGDYLCDDCITDDGEIDKEEEMSDDYQMDTRDYFAIKIKKLESELEQAQKEKDRAYQLIGCIIEEYDQLPNDVKSDPEIQELSDVIKGLEPDDWDEEQMFGDNLLEKLKRENTRLKEGIDKIEKWAESRSNTHDKIQAILQACDYAKSASK
jgi:hypothetical protein